MTNEKKNLATGENYEKTFVGIDVAKSELVVHVIPTKQHFTVQNDQNGINELVKKLKEINPKQIVCEATGGLERLMLTTLAAEGLPIVRLNPKQARDLAKGLGKLAKTDAIDAQMLAKFAKLDAFEVRPVPTKETLEMSDYLTRRHQLVTMRTMEENRLKQAYQKKLKDSIEKVIECLNEHINDINASIGKMIDANPDWSEQDKILRSVPGIGPQTSHIVIAALSECSTLNRQEVAALVGVAPFNRDSGTKSGVRSIHGGRADVRSILYMATLNGIRFNPVLKAFYNQLTSRGKSPKVAIVAAMRKLLTIINTMLKTKTMWNENHVTNRTAV
ncbi:MAG: IS110 family transposase [Thermoguttaceae bacterium]